MKIVTIVKRPTKVSAVYREDVKLLNQLSPHLTRAGVQWLMLGPQPVIRPMLLVNLPHSFMGTHLYIDRFPVLDGPVVCGFSGIYLGMARHPARVADRLKWLLRHGELRPR